MNWEPVIGRGHSHSSRDGFGLACIGVLSLLWSGSATAAVGRVPGDFAVDPSGAAAYTIPINVAPGINGLAPNLALVYNSQAGDGLAGIRWTLAGYSSITRCGDGLQFCLGGQKLVKDAAASNTGAYGAEGVAYRTEIDSFVRVVSHVSGTATSFEARHPDGLTYFYGYTSDSKIPSTSTNTWAVNQIQDKFFNSVRFTYSAADDNNLKQVDWSDHCTAYGCASGSGARYSLVFSYTLRAAAAQRSGYSFGASWTRNKWLSSIDYKLDGVRVHQYQLGIATPTSDGTQRTQVGTITLCGATNSDCFTSTALQWQNGVADWNASTDLGDANWGGGSGVKPYLVGDFDGDGHTDMLAKDSSNAGIWNILRGTGTSFASSSVGSALSQFAGAARAVVADFNGDGMSDVLGVAPGSLNWQVALATGLTGTGTFSSHTTVFHQSNTSISYTPTVLDYDGDGLADLAYFTASDAPARIRIAHNPGVHNNSSIDFDAGPAPSAPNPNPNLTMRSADFDGDGRQDLLVGNVTNGNLQWLAYRYAGTSGWQLIGGTPADVYVAYSGTDISAIDVNGDGLADLAYYQENTTATSGPGWQTMISKGATGFESPQAVSYTAQADATSRFAAVVDYDGDGRGDLLTHNVSGSPVAGQGLAVVHLSNGTSLNGGLKAEPLNGVTATTMSGVAVYAMDSTGDGLRDVVAWVPSTARYSLRTHKQALRDLVTSVTDGLGNSVSAITYTPLTDSSNYSAAAYPPSPALPAVYNHVVRGNAMQVVSQYTTTDGIGGSYNLNFSYWNLWVSTAGNTSLGFRQIKRHDGRSGAFDTVEQYRQDSPYTGQLAARAVCQQQNSCAVESGPKLSLTTNTWGKTAGSRYSASDPYYYFVFPTEEATTEFDPANGTTAIRVTKHSLPATNWNTDLGVPNVDTVTVYPSAQATAGWETTRTYTYGNGDLAGTGVTALPVSSSITVWPDVITSPSFTAMLTTTPESAPSPKFGNRTSIKCDENDGENLVNGAHNCKRIRRIALLGVTFHHPCLVKMGVLDGFSHGMSLGIFGDDPFDEMAIAGVD